MKDGMIWLEMISIRTAGIIEVGRVYEICRQSFQSVAVERLLKLTVYCNARYGTDISIHLLWKSDPGSRSVLGSTVSSALRDLGLISHTLWIEQEEFITDTTSKMSSSRTAINLKMPR